MAIVSMEEWKRSRGFAPGAAPPPAVLSPALEIQIRRLLGEKDRVIAYQTGLIRQLQTALAQVQAPMVHYKVKRRLKSQQPQKE